MSHLKTSGIFIFSLQCLSRFWIKKTNDFVRNYAWFLSIHFSKYERVVKTVVEILRKYRSQFAIYILGQFHPKGKLCFQPLVTVLPWEAVARLGCGQRSRWGGGYYGHFPKGTRPSVHISFPQILAVTLGHVSFLVWINECVGQIFKSSIYQENTKVPGETAGLAPANSSTTANLRDSQASPSLPWGQQVGSCLEGTQTLTLSAPMWTRSHPRPQLTLKENGPLHTPTGSQAPVLCQEVLCWSEAGLSSSPRGCPYYQGGNSEILSDFREETRIVAGPHGDLGTWFGFRDGRKTTFPTLWNINT